MTINARTVTTRITAAQTLLANLHARLPRAIHAVTIGEHPGSDDRPRPEDAGIRGINWITDPTAAAALTAVHRRDTHLDDVEQHLATLTLSIGLLSAFCDEWAPMVVDHPRCTGGGSVEPWTRPDCTNLVGYYRTASGQVSLRGDGLCDACRKRRDRWQRDTDGEVA